MVQQVREMRLLVVPPGILVVPQEEETEFFGVPSPLAIPRLILSMPEMLAWRAVRPNLPQNPHEGMHPS